MKLGEILLCRGTRPRLDIGDRGYLEVRDEDWIRFVPREGHAQTFAAKGLLQFGRTIHYAADGDRGRVILVPSEGTRAYLFDAPSRSLQPVATLRRWMDPAEMKYDPGGLYWVHLIDADDSVLIVHECGVVHLGLDGRTIWQREHECFSSFEGAREGVAWFQDMNADRRWGYRLDTGSEAS